MWFTVCDLSWALMLMWDIYKKSEFSSHYFLISFNFLPPPFPLIYPLKNDTLINEIKLSKVTYKGGAKAICLWAKTISVIYNGTLAGSWITTLGSNLRRGETEKKREAIFKKHFYKSGKRPIQSSPKSKCDALSFLYMCIIEVKCINKLFFSPPVCIQFSVYFCIQFSVYFWV